MTDNVFIFVPNIIGYARVIFALISFYYMRTDYVIASWCYIISSLLDAFDGHAARIFNQSTKFGALLDQLTDRCGTVGLIAVLCTLYPDYTFLFQLSISIDISCHWVHQIVTLMQGKTSHKFVDLSENVIMRVYYTSRPVLFFMCAGNEAFYSSLYLVYFSEGPMILGIGLFRAVCYLCFPIAVVKLLIAVLQGYIAFYNVGNLDIEERKKLKK